VVGQRMLALDDGNDGLLVGGIRGTLLEQPPMGG